MVDAQQDGTTNPPDAPPQRPVRHLILGTAGHIDHGKSALVEALTGRHPDRLPEERARGMTIELGFAHFEAGPFRFGVVDVPGHERFIRTMVAGAMGVDLALLVVAADDSVMPQTREHVEILELLGVQKMVVALSKADLVDAEMQELVAAEIAELLASTRFAGARVVAVSALRREGLDALRAALVEAAGELREKDTLDRPFRMPIDRVFTVAGRGTVVTGSVLTGRLRVGEAVDVLPAMVRTKVREAQSHGMPADFVEAGQRAALNLQGLNRDAIQRGDELAAPEALTPSRLLDAQVRCLPSVRQPIKNNARFRLEIGTRELLVRCVCLSEAAIAPGSSGYVQLRAREPLVAMHGQRFILREENASRTVGGGVVLRVGRRRLSARMSDELAGLGVLHEGSATQRLAEVLRNQPFESLSDDQLSLCAGIPRSEVPELLGELEREGVLVTLEGIDRPVSKAFLNGLLERTVRWMRTYHAAHPDEPGCSVDTVTGGIERRSARGVGKELLQRLVAEGQVKVLGRYACLKEFAPALSAQDEKVLAAMLAALREAAFQPPSPAELATRLAATLPRVEKLLKVAAATGQIARIDGQIHLHADREGELRAIVRRLFESGGPFTVSAMREAVGTSRKYAVPLAEYLDRIGFTRRSGDTRTVIASEP